MSPARSGRARAVARRLAGPVATALGRSGDAATDPAGETGRAADASLLLGSPLFDDAWYARVTGFRGARPEAVDDYLRRPRDRRPSPHPMFDREHVTTQLIALDHDVEGRDVFMLLVRGRAKVSPHPLFDLPGYLRGNPEARRHPGGAAAHYLEVGAAAGAVPNDWLAEGRGLDDWLRERFEEWDERRVMGLPQTVLRRFLTEQDPVDHGSAETETPAAPHPGGTITVVVEPGHEAATLAETLRSLAEQTGVDWRAVVVDTGGVHDLEEELAAALPAGRWSRVAAEGLDRVSALRKALAVATGTDVAFLHNGETWQPDRLQRLQAWRRATGAPVVCDVIERTRTDGSTALVGRGLPAGPNRTQDAPPLGGLLVSTVALTGAGLPDPRAGAGWEFDLAVRLATPAGIPSLRRVGVHQDMATLQLAQRLPPARRPRLNVEVPGRNHAVLSERLVDWEAAAAAPRVTGLTSVVMATYRDWRMTQSAVEHVLASDGPEVEVLVVDNGCGSDAAAVLASLPERFTQVRVLHEPVNQGFALGNNIGAGSARGDVVVFLNNDTIVDDGWLAPLRAALEDDAVLGAQAVLLFPTGTVQSAGIAFPQHGGLPYSFLQGFPAEDTGRVDELRFAALTGAALAVRTADVLDLHGFDATFLNGMEDIDLCLRLQGRRDGHFAVCPDSQVVHLESQTPGRLRHHAANRAVFLDRWRGRSGDDAALWAALGYEVHGHAVRSTEVGHPGRRTLDPLLTRRPASIVESPPRLRWAIKNPAPAGPPGDLWGDTHFAAALAAGLRQQGQDVVVDRRPEHERRTGRHDDVALVLRGLVPFRPSFENVTIGWVISHPDKLSLTEAASYDRLAAASEIWAERQGVAWGLPVEPLLQATDPDVFHPDLAVPDTGHPVLFVGSSRKVLRPIVAAAVDNGLPLSIYGGDWKPFVEKRFIKGGYLRNERLGAAYRSAGVVLNDHWEDMRVDGFISNRLFDAAAAGARVITDDIAGLPDFFGDSVQVMRSPEDLVRWSSLSDPDTVFGSDEDRRAVADLVHREHSFAARAGRLVEMAVEARRARGFAP